MTAYSLVTRTVVGKTLPLAYQAEPKLYRSVTVAQLFLEDLAVGDFVQASGCGQVELGGEDPDRAMHCRYLKATKSGINSHTEGLILAKPMGHNFTDDQHYSLLSAAGSFRVDAAWTGSVQLMLVMYAAALSGVATNPNSLAVKYVELRADVFKP